MNQYQKIMVELSHDQQIFKIILNAPKGNVLDVQMMADITSALATYAAQPEIKAVVFEGPAAIFSFGASVPEHTAETVAEMLKNFHRLFRELIALSKPCIAVVRGQCLGGGLELAAFCHWIFAADDAQFGQPEIKLAVFPPVASLILPHRIGQSVADDLVLTGRSISAQQALAIGLVHMIDEDPDEQAIAFIEKKLLHHSATALHFAAKSSRYAMHQAFLQHIAAVEKMYVDELMRTEDANEGIAAFFGKAPASLEEQIVRNEIRNGFRFQR